MTFKKKTENENKKNEQEKNDDDEMEWTEESKRKKLAARILKANHIRWTKEENKERSRERMKKKLRTRIYTGCRAKKAAFTNKFTFIHHIRTHEQTQIERAPVCVYAPPFAHCT